MVYIVNTLIVQYKLQQSCSYLPTLPFHTKVYILSYGIIQSENWSNSQQMLKYS